MGKSKREYREEEEYASGPSVSGSDDSSDSSNSPSGSSSSSSSSNDDSNSEQERRQRRHIKKRSKRKREKRSKRDNSSEEEEEEDGYGDSEDRRKRSKYTVEEHVEERRHHSSTGGSRRKRRHHHHHHRKHKHKHRRHHRHHSEERSKGGGVVERPGEGRKGREVEERRGRERLEPERERRASKETDRRERKEEKRNRDKARGDARPVRSKWDEEEDTPYDPGRRIKLEPGLEGDGSEGGWDGEYENGGSRKRKHHQQQQQQRRRHQQQENSHRPPHRAKVEVKEEPGSRSRQDTSNSLGASENGRTNWGQGGDGGGGGGGGGAQSENPAEGEERQKPNLAVTGKLAEDANTYNGVVIKYSQPPEARKPKRRWRWYIFKGDEELPFLPLHRQSAYLIGRDRKVADIPTDHPSCSKQHAVLQYRLVTYNRGDGTKGRTVKPYILDLESANGTYVNNRRIEAKRFVELLEKDVVKFGYSSREYILLHEGSKGDDEDIPDTGTDLSPVSMLRS